MYCSGKGNRERSGIIKHSLHNGVVLTMENRVLLFALMLGGFVHLKKERIILFVGSLVWHYHRCQQHHCENLLLNVHQNLMPLPNDNQKCGEFVQKKEGDKTGMNGCMLPW